MLSLMNLVPSLRPYAAAFFRIAAQYGHPVQLTSTRRTLAQQQLLFRRFQQGQSRYPAAVPGTSKHERGMAFDVTGRPEDLAWLGALWESWGGRWGGRFHDPIHFETP